MQVALAIEVLLHDRARVPFQEAVQQRARPPSDTAIADRVRKRGATDDEVRRGPACDRVFEADLVVGAHAGLARRWIFRPIGREPPHADARLEEPLIAIQASEAIAIALPPT